MGKKKKALSSKEESLSTDKSRDRLREMVLDHLGLPRPGTGEHIKNIQDKLLPVFMEASRHAWMASSPMIRSDSPIYGYLSRATETEAAPQDIRVLNDALEDMGVNDLLRDMAASPNVAMLGKIPLDPYEARLLRAAGHPEPEGAVQKLLRRASKEPGILASPSAKLVEAAEISLSVHGDINLIINPQAKGPEMPAAKKPKKRKLAIGLGKLFSGTALIAGNAIFIPSVPITAVTALPLVGSLAAGIAAVGEGIGQLRGEGE